MNTVQNLVWCVRNERIKWPVSDLRLDSDQSQTRNRSQTQDQSGTQDRSSVPFYLNLESDSDLDIRDLDSNSDNMDLTTALMLIISWLRPRLKIQQSLCLSVTRDARKLIYLNSCVSCCYIWKRERSSSSVGTRESLQKSRSGLWHHCTVRSILMLLTANATCTFLYICKFCVWLYQIWTRSVPLWLDIILMLILQNESMQSCISIPRHIVGYRLDLWKSVCALTCY